MSGSVCRIGALIWNIDIVDFLFKYSTSAAEWVRLFAHMMLNNSFLKRRWRSLFKYKYVGNTSGDYFLAYFSSYRSSSWSFLVDEIGWVTRLRMSSWRQFSFFFLSRIMYTVCILGENQSSSVQSLKGVQTVLPCAAKSHVILLAPCWAQTSKNCSEKAQNVGT